jgi:hypothetical protein
MKAAILAQAVQAQNHAKAIEERVAQERRVSTELHDNILRAQAALQADSEKLNREKNQFTEEKLRVAQERESIRLEKEQLSRDKENLRLEKGIFESSKAIYLKTLQEKEKLFEEQIKIKDAEVLYLKSSLVLEQDMLKKATVSIVEKSTILRMEQESFEKMKSSYNEKIERDKKTEEDTSSTATYGIEALSVLDDALRSDVSSTSSSPARAPHSSPAIVDITLGALSPTPMLLSEYEPVPYLEDGYHVVSATGETAD